MKISNHITIVGSLLLAAGCAHNERTASKSGSQAQYSANLPASYSSQTTASTTPTYSDNHYQAGEFSSTGSDQRLVTKVQECFQKDAALSTLAPRIEVKAQNGAVTLSGSVPNDQDKQRIESAARSTSGVVSVVNQLQVSLQPTSTGQSSRLYQESNGQPLAGLSSTSETDTIVKTAPASTPLPTPSDVNSTGPASVSQNAPEPTVISPTSQPGTPSRIYSTNQSSTTLSTPSDTTALNISVQGLTEMDKNLGQKIMQELQTDAALSGQISGINLSADNGKIILRGTVKSEDQKKSIETAVQRVTGVTSVENNIQVGSNPTSTSDVEPK